MADDYCEKHDHWFGLPECPFCEIETQQRVDKAFYDARIFTTEMDKGINVDTIASNKEKIEELGKEIKLDVRQKSQMAVSEIILEMHARGFEFLGIDVYNSAGYKFTLEDGKIRVPLVALNGLGGAVVENVINEREVGKFLSYEDLKRRTKASQTVIEKLKEVNAIDGLSDTNQKSLF